jgi:hypothetical protein
VLFKELIEQHRVHRFVAHRVHFSIATASHQIWGYVFYVFGNEPEAARRVDSAIAGLEEAKNLAGRVLRLIQDRLGDAEFGKNLTKLSKQFAASADQGFEFQKITSLTPAYR